MIINQILEITNSEDEGERRRPEVRIAKISIKIARKLQIRSKFCKIRTFPVYIEPFDGVKSVQLQGAVRGAIWVDWANAGT